MTGTEVEAALLLADITGSTRLYEEVGDAAAMRQVTESLDISRKMARRLGGRFTHSKGDDLLCTFPSAIAALRAARGMLERHRAGPLNLHAGLHFGRMIQTRSDVFGDSVNVTARLAELAKPGEILMSEGFVAQLPPEEAADLQVLDQVTFKGKTSAMVVYLLPDENAEVRTQVAFGHGTGHTRTRHQRLVPSITLGLRYGDLTHSCGEGTVLSIGRSLDCDVVIPRPWVSRHHATVSVHRGQVRLSDNSFAGTYILMRDGYEMFIRREGATLSGTGVFSPAVQPLAPEAETVGYEVIQT